MAGRSIRMLAEVGRTVYGFDSFLGLPHDWGLGEARGTFACARPPEMPGNVIIIEGLFSDTLEQFLREHDGVVGFVHIDSDLYCSCAYVLDCLRDRFIVGSVIIFDDIRQHVAGEAVPGERRAWERYCAGVANGKGRQFWDMVGEPHVWGEVWRRVI